MTPEHIVRRAESIVARLDLGPDGLRRPQHLPGALADLVAGFDVDAFEAEARRSERMAPGRTDGYLTDAVLYQGDTSYHAWVDGDEERVAQRRRDPAAWASTATLPLPRWALDLQQELLVRLYDARAFGWSAEVFYSFQAGASMGVHADNDDVFTVQLWGAKTWEIAPASLPALHEHVARGRVHRDGPQDAWHFVPGQAPTLVEPLRLTLRAGDFLATPAFALHRVEATEDRRSVSFNVSICREEVWERHAARGGVR